MLNVVHQHNEATMCARHYQFELRERRYITLNVISALHFMQAIGCVMFMLKHARLILPRLPADRPQRVHRHFD